MYITTWVNFKNILSEKRQKQKYTICQILIYKVHEHVMFICDDTIVTWSVLGGFSEKGHMGVFWGDGNTLFYHNLCGGYMGTTMSKVHWILHLCFMSFSVCELYLNLKTILGDSILLLYWLRILYVDYIISILTVLSFIFQEIRMLFFFKLPTGSGMEGVHHL